MLEDGLSYEGITESVEGSDGDGIGTEIGV